MRTISFFAVCLMTIMFISCRKDDVKIAETTGSLHIDVGLFIDVNEVNSRLKSAQQTEDFKVILYNEDGTVSMTFEQASLMPDTIQLEIGNYYVEAHSDNNLPAEFENPYYYGVSDNFTISSNTQQSILVNCQLANTIITVVYSDNVISSFTDYTTTVSSALDSLVFLKDETRMGYFRTMPLNIKVALTYLEPDGTEVTKSLSGSIPDPLANRHYEIFVDASIDEGMASFQILLDETAAPVEIIEVTEVPDFQQDGLIGYGELLITEIMYDPSSLTDTEGEWFEIYNHSDQAINLQNLILGRDDTNRHTITDSIELVPGEYFVFQRTGIATGAVNSYVYGSDISLTNTGAVLAIFNEGTESDPGELIFSVNYGGVNFPGGSGASISLDPDLMNAAAAVLGTSWCTSVSVYGTGDQGTPGVANDACQ